MRKTEEKKVTVEADKVKEEKSLKVAGGRCWKRVWMTVFMTTGDHLHLLLKKMYLLKKTIRLFILGQNFFLFS